MATKRQLGQFFTKNTDYILSGMCEFVEGKNITDPFAGAGDLLAWAVKNNAKTTTGFDCDRSYVDDCCIFFNDSLKNPQKYEFVLTNPPYLYQNKMADNTLLKNSPHTDLYQLSLEKIMDSDEGIVIVPINFLSAENSKYIRSIFLEKFEILKINYFTEQVFEDTTYNVIAFYYRKKTTQSLQSVLKFTIFPQQEKKEIPIYERYNWQIGGEFLEKINTYGNPLKITRLEESDLHPGNNLIRVAYNHLDTPRDFFVSDETAQLLRKNIVLLKAIDTGTPDGKICLENIRDFGYEALVSIKTSRNQIYLIFPDVIPVETQEKLISMFNEELNEERKKYNSLFMTNFRDNDRKRISFNFAYNFINYLYFEKLQSEPISQQMFFFEKNNEYATHSNVMKSNIEYLKISISNPEPTLDKTYMALDLNPELDSYVEKTNRIKEILTTIKTLRANRDDAEKYYEQLFDLFRSKYAGRSELNCFFAACDSTREGISIDDFKELVDLFLKKRPFVIETPREWVQALIDSIAQKSKGKIGERKLLGIAKKIGYAPVKDWDEFFSTPHAVAFFKKGIFDIRSIKKNLNIELPNKKQNKMLDLILKSGDRYAFFEAKHIKEEGGAQNKQVEELISLISDGNKNPHVYLCSFLDGKYSNKLLTEKIVGYQCARMSTSSSNKISKQQSDIAKALKNSKKSFWLNTAGFTAFAKDFYDL